MWAGRRVRQALELLRLADIRLIETQEGRVAEQVRESLTPDVSGVFGCGGDGTVSDVAGGLAGSDVPFHIIPAGTTNVLAREFGIPLDPVRAVEAASGLWQARRLRTWRVGWDARLMYRAPSSLKRYLGTVGFGPLSLWLTMTYEFPVLRVEGKAADGTHMEATGTSVIVSNVRSWTGVSSAFRYADATSGVLQVAVLERASRVQLATFWALMMVPGTNPTDLAGVRVLPLESLKITADGPIPVEAHVNGDPVEHTPLTIEPAEPVLVAVPQS